MEGESRTVVGDLEAGIGTLFRLPEGGADVVLVVAQPTAKAIDVARRATQIASGRAARVILIANRVCNAEDVELIRAGVGFAGELVEVPDDPEVARADEEGVAPIDAAPDAPAVQALRAMALSLSG